MVGVGKIIKQAQKMQKQMESVQQELAQKEIVVSSGGAVTIRINGQSEILSLSIDKEFLKEDKEVIESTLLFAVKEAVAKAKKLSETELGKVSSGFNLHGMI